MTASMFANMLLREVTPATPVNRPLSNKPCVKLNFWYGKSPLRFTSNELMMLTGKTYPEVTAAIHRYLRLGFLIKTGRKVMPETYHRWHVEYQWVRRNVDKALNQVKGNPPCSSGPLHSSLQRLL